MAKKTVVIAYAVGVMVALLLVGCGAREVDNPDVDSEAVVVMGVYYNAAEDEDIYTDGCDGNFADEVLHYVSDGNSQEVETNGSGDYFFTKILEESNGFNIDIAKIMLCQVFMFMPSFSWIPSTPPHYISGVIGEHHQIVLAYAIYYGSYDMFMDNFSAFMMEYGFELYVLNDDILQTGNLCSANSKFPVCSNRQLRTGIGFYARAWYSADSYTLDVKSLGLRDKSNINTLFRNDRVYVFLEKGEIFGNILQEIYVNVLHTGSCMNEECIRLRNLSDTVHVIVASNGFNVDVAEFTISGHFSSVPSFSWISDQPPIHVERIPSWRLMRYRIYSYDFCPDVLLDNFTTFMISYGFEAYEGSFEHAIDMYGSILRTGNFRSLNSKFPVCSNRQFRTGIGFYARAWYRLNAPPGEIVVSFRKEHVIVSLELLKCESYIWYDAIIRVTFS